MTFFDRLLPNTPALFTGPPRPVRPNAPHVVVIGAGFGGLAAAVRLLARGYRVTVVDRLEQAGGRARVHSMKGYTFDAGPTIVTAPFLLEELWTMAGRNFATDIDLRAVSPFYRVRFDDGTWFDYTGDADAMRAEVARVSPEDVEGYAALLKKSKRIFEVGFERLGHLGFEDASTMARVAPTMIELESWRTVHGLVSRHIRSEKLRQVLTFHPLLVGGSPYRTTSIYALVAHLERHWGVWFPMGGTGVLVRGLVKLVESLGGVLRLGAEVEEIVVERGASGGSKGAAKGVRLKGGERIDADLVVSNADAAWTYKKLVAPEHRTHWTDARLERADYSMSLFVWYFGTKKQYPDVAHHTLVLGPRYRGLLEDIFEHKVLADDFSLYLHRPTATDPSLAPEGCDAFYVLSPVPHLDAEVDWSERVESYRAAIERTLEQALLPGLSDAIEVSRTLTPVGFREDYLSLKGAAFSFEPTLAQSAFFRPHNRSEDVEHLFLVGAGTHPGAGLPGVLSTARVLDTLVPDP